MVKTSTKFLVTLGDVGNTTYSSRFIPNTDWEFRIRALNRRVPANAPNAGSAVPLVWSDPIPATPGSDTAQKRAEGLTVTRSEMHHEGRTGLILTWNKATTVRNADGGSDDALAYRIEYSNTGLRDEGYDWKVLDEGFTILLLPTLAPVPLMTGRHTSTTQIDWTGRRQRLGGRSDAGIPGLCAQQM